MGSDIDSYVYTSVVTHAEPHADEFGALNLYEIGAPRFTFHPDFEWETLTTGKLPEGKTCEDYPNKCFLGCAGSPTDEHGRGKRSSCIRCTAEKLRLFERRPYLKLVVSVIESADRETVPTADHISTVTKALFRMPNPPSEKTVYKWFSRVFRLIVESEKNLHFRIWKSVRRQNLPEAEEREEIMSEFFRVKRPWTSMSIKALAELIPDVKEASEWLEYGERALRSAQEQFEKARKEIASMQPWAKFTAFNGKTVRLLLAYKVDNYRFAAAGRILGFNICVQRTPYGNVQILTNQKLEINLSQVAAALRRRESELRGEENFMSQYELEQEGTVGLWHLHEDIGGTQLYNGTLTACAVEPTLISIEEIARIVVELIEKRSTSS